MQRGDPPAPRSSRSKRPTIGLLTTGFAYGPERRLFDGMLAAARSYDVNLTCFHGQRLNAGSASDRRANVLYELVDARNCDGLVVWSGALGENVTPDDLRAFCTGFGLPVVTIGDTFEGIPSVVFDFYSGMREQMLHLVRDHGYRRVAFLRGPERHNEAEQRYRAYREVLSSQGVAFDPNLVVAGTFLRDSGNHAVRVLLDERRVTFDAIAAVNDETALGALEELSLRKIAVPEEVALTGFDDDDAVRWTSPQLTTVRFGIDAAGERALAVLLSLLSGEEPPRETLLPLELKVRASCGCHPHEKGAARTEVLARDLEHVELPPRADAAESSARRMYEAFAADVATGGSSSVALFQSVLRENLIDRPVYVTAGGHDSSIAAQLEATALHDVLAAVHRRFAGESAWTEEQRAHERELVWQISRTIVDHGQRLPTFGGWARESQVWQVQALGHKLLHTFNLSALSHAAADALPAVGIRRFVIALYEGGANGTGRGEQSRLLAGSDGKRLLPEELTSPLFTSKELAPRGIFWEGGAVTLAIEPLIFDEHHLGFAVFEVESAAQGAIIVALRKQLSAALFGAVLIGRLEQRATELLQARRVQEDQRQKLVTAERMAWLGRLTAGIAHEMNTPVAAVRTSLSTLASLVDEYRASIGDDSVGTRDHQELAGEMESATTLAKRAAESAARFVAELHAQTRDQGAKAGTVFNVVPVLHEVLSLLRHTLETAGCRVAYRPASHFIRVRGLPNRLSQAITNLVMNAIDASPRALRHAPSRAHEAEAHHEGDHDHAHEGGTITLTVEVKEDGVLVQVIDEGEGIAPDVLPHVFDPMWSSRAFGQRMGLGLSTARDIIEGELGGTIRIATELGVGTTVRVLLPLVESL